MKMYASGGLIVDDRPYLGELLAHQLMKEEVRFICAGNTESVKKGLEDSTADTVLLEMCLSEISDPARQFPVRWDIFLFNRIGAQGIF
jgi:DNA-binding NtrC family response regulator